jgi:hypothetical protein
VPAGTGELLSALTVIVNEENDLGPNQNQGGPSDETMRYFEVVVELNAHNRVGKREHHQEQSQDDP